MDRRYRTGAAAEHVLCMDELRAMARWRLLRFALEYIDDGAD
jgi:hypothetical protein